MKVFIVVCCIVAGMVGGFFVGGYSYNRTHPIRERPLTRNGTWEEMRALDRRFTEALERHEERGPWLFVGIVIGGCAGAAVSPIPLALFRRIRSRSSKAPSIVSTDQ